MLPYNIDLMEDCIMDRYESKIPKLFSVHYSPEEYPKVDSTWYGDGNDKWRYVEGAVEIASTHYGTTITEIHSIPVVILSTFSKELREVFRRPGTRRTLIDTLRVHIWNRCIRGNYSRLKEFCTEFTGDNDIVTIATYDDACIYAYTEKNNPEYEPMCRLEIISYSLSNNVLSAMMYQSAMLQLLDFVDSL